MGIGWMPQEVEVYVEMVRKVVESEERENENAE